MAEKFGQIFKYKIPEIIFNNNNDNIYITDINCNKWSTKRKIVKLKGIMLKL